MASKVPVKRGRESEARTPMVARQPELWSGGLWEPVERLHREMDRIFDRFFENFFDFSLAPSTFGRRDVAAPRFDAWADDDGYHVEVELPGVKADDVDVSLSGNILTIKGKKERAAKGKGEEAQAQWRQEFERTLTLPDGIDLEKVEASLRDGLLHVMLPKSEAAKPRRIAVKSE